MGWSIHDFSVELRHLEALQVKREGTQLLDSMFKSFLAKLRAMKDMSVQTAVDLMDAIENCKLPQEQKTAMLQCVDDVCSVTSTGKLVQGSQTVVAVSKYMSKEDWRLLDALTTDSDVLRCVAARLRKMALGSLREGTKRQVV